MRAMAAAAFARQRSPRAFHQHLLLQFERAVFHDDNSALLPCVEAARACLHADRFDELVRTIDLNSFPWQRDGFALFSARSEWRTRFPSTASTQRLTEIDPSGGDRLRPYVRDNRSVVFFFSGNRQAYTGLEHEPASRYFEQDIHALAEGYVARAARSVERLLGAQGVKLVMPVYGALRSRHEQRLIHFALSLDPSFVHPSVDALAEEIARVTVLMQTGAGSTWVPKSERELAESPPFLAVTHSYGSSAVVQCLTRVQELAEGMGLTRSSIEQYFARGVCVQLGGYRLDMPAAGPIHHCVLSPLDEIALGSPSAPARYTSPVVFPSSVWEAFDVEALSNIARGELDRVPISHMAIRPNVELWTPVLLGPTCYDASGTPVAEFETSNGHHVGGYVEAVRHRLPKLAALLARLAHCSRTQNTIER